MIKYLKPSLLQPGDKIALVSPSWGGPFHFPWILEKAVENIKSLLNVTVVEFPTCRMDSETIYNNPQIRAEDLNNAFADPSIKGVITTIGGNDSIRILEYLDTETIFKNPKVIMGFSDSTTFLSWLNQLGMVTLYGPSMMAGWAQIHNYPELSAYSADILMNINSNKILPVFNHYNDGYPDWSSPESAGKIKQRASTEGPLWLQGSGTAKGRLWGGCINVLDFMKGTRYWPDESFWGGKILFLETSEEKVPLEYISSSLCNLGIQGVFDKISGLLFGRAYNYNDKEKSELRKNIVQVVRGEFGNKDLPIITEMDFGHTDPKLILPLGIEYEIDTERKEISRTEKIFTEDA